MRPPVEAHHGETPPGPSAAGLRALAERHPYGLCELDAEGRIRWANDRLSELLGIADPLVGRDLLALLPPPAARSLGAALGRAAEGIEVQLDLVAARGDDDADPDDVDDVDGADGAVHLAVTASALQQPEAGGRWLVVRDDTARRRSEIELVAQDARLRGMFTRAPHGIAITDVDGRYVHVNPAFCRVAGRSPAELLGRSWRDPTHVDDHPLQQERIDALLAGATIPTFTKRYRHPDWTERWARLTASTVPDATGRPRNLVAFVEDVTAARAEEERRDQERALTRIAGRAARLGGWAVDVETGVRQWTAEVHAILDHPDPEVAARDPRVADEALELYLPEDRGELEEAYSACVASGTPFDLELRIRTFTGGQLWVRVVGEAERVEGTTRRVVGAVQDVTAERAAAAALQERGRRVAEQAALLDEAQDAIYVCDLDDRVTYWNRSAATLYGWSASEAVGRTIRELLRPDPQRYEEARRDLWHTDRWAGEVPHRHRDGRPLTIETRWTLVRDDDGRATTILALDTDVSARRRSEQHALRAQRMESIGTLASGIAHDLNNVLSPILLSIQLLLLEGRDGREQDILRTIETSAQRGAEMVAQVVSFARGVDGRRASVDVGRLLTDVHRIARDTFPKGLDLHLEVDDDLPPVEGDPTQLHQVLVNLAVNARDALRGRDDGRLTLRARSVHLDAATADELGLAAGAQVRIEVEDSGPGMAPEVLDRLFEPFFTTKAHGEGTGLGLSTSRAIVTSHRGAIDVTSERGRGTRFTLHLPAFPAGAGVRAPLTDAPPPTAAGERLLLVDDEDEIRDAARRTLEAAGYDVVEARDGAEAIERFDTDAVGFDLVLTDVRMPRVDGTATIRALQRRSPGLPIVASSGLHGDLQDRDVVPEGTAAYLPKPYTSLQLLTTIRQALDAAAS